MGTTGKVWFLSFHSSGLSVAIVLTLFQLLVLVVPHKQLISCLFVVGLGEQSRRGIHGLRTGWSCGGRWFVLF